MNSTDLINPDTTNCPHCGAKPMIHSYVCGTTFPNIAGNCSISEICKLNNEVARLREEIAKLHTENICLQELIQEFYEWSRRDYPKIVKPNYHSQLV